MGFLMLRRETVQLLLSPIAGFGFVPREVLTDRERFTLELMNELDALTLSPPEFFTRLSMAWLGTAMTEPDPATASKLADAIVSGIAGTTDLAVRSFTNAARTASAFEFRSFLSASPAETAAMYARRLYRRINSDAEQNRITVGDFRLYRDTVHASLRKLAERSGADRAAIGRLLLRLGLIRSEELKAMEAP